MFYTIKNYVFSDVIGRKKYMNDRNSIETQITPCTYFKCYQSPSFLASESFLTEIYDESKASVLSPSKEKIGNASYD